MFFPYKNDVTCMIPGEKGIPHTYDYQWAPAGETTARQKRGDGGVRSRGGEEGKRREEEESEEKEKRGEPILCLLCSAV